MNVQHATGIARDKAVAENAHKPGKDHEVGRVCVNRLCQLVIKCLSAIKFAMADNASRDASFLRAFQSEYALDVADDAGDVEIAARLRCSVDQCL